MSTLTELTQTAQEQTLAAIGQSQQLVLDAVRTWAEAVEKAVPAVPSVPFAEELPTPQQLIESSFTFAEQLLKTQREFAEQVLAATAPALKPNAPKPAITTTNRPKPALKTNRPKPAPKTNSPKPALNTNRPKPAPKTNRPKPALKTKRPKQA
jgi:hypothetical protein